MALANYSDLKTSIANWLHRTDLTATIPDFISMAESRFSRMVNTILQETDASLTCTVGSRYVALPTDFNNPIALWNEQWQPRVPIRYLDPTTLIVNTGYQSFPRFFTIDNSNIAFEVKADIAYPLTFRYYKRYQLSDASPTNTLLTEYPDLYLYGALLESAPFLNNDERLGMWQERFDRAVKEVNDSESRSKSLSTLSTELGVRSFNSSKSNIYRGF